MWMNMWGNRKSAFKKRSRPPPPPKGLVWPVTNRKTGDRSTAKTNQAIWVKAVEAADADAAKAAKKEKGWRFGYVPHVEANVRVSLKSPDAALAVADAGLTAAHDLFEFVRDDKTVKFSDAMKTFKGSFKTGFMEGESKGKDKGPRSVKVPYAGTVGKPYYAGKKKLMNGAAPLEGDVLKEQLDTWVNYGVIEPDCREAITACIDHPEWLDLSNHYFILLGATSAMGPLPLLLSLGANIIAIDIDIPPVWEKLFKMVRESSGTLTYPIKGKPSKNLDDMTDGELAKISGANLLEDVPEIANWLCEVCPEDKITIGNYTYLDGEKHVRLALACDAVISKLAAKRDNLAIAFLCTPTDCHPIPKDAYDAAIANKKGAPFWQALWPICESNVLKPVTPAKGDAIYLVDGIVGRQGPNYILAKRLQHWRAIKERAVGHVISSNIAPSTATLSVVSNGLFAAGYGGMHLFKPFEVMYQQTSNAVMGALLIHDISNKKAWAFPQYKLANPLQLFEHGSFHGGVWRSGFKIASIGEISAMIYWMAIYGPQIGAALATVSGVTIWVLTGWTGLDM